MNRNSYKWTGNVTVSALAGVVADEGIQGKEIVGRWKDQDLMLRPSNPRRTLVAEFVNWPDDSQGILKFVRKYGPLSKPQRGEEFRQSIQLWRDHQSWLRRNWTVNPLGIKVGMQEGDMLEIAPKQLTLRLQSLKRFLEFEIWLAPISRRRKCQRPQCNTPYFIANNPKQQFCDEKCAEWAQRQHKERWWAEHGKQWREERTKRNRGKLRRKV